MKRILIAGIGNIFHGDDAFGCEVVRELNRRPLPEEVTVTDFGIRSYDLVYALTDNFDAVILVDATPRGTAPGTLYLIDPELDGFKELESTSLDAHTMNPVSVLETARLVGNLCPKLFLVGCEPEAGTAETERMGLSPKVQAAVPEAATMVVALVENLLSTNQHEPKVAGPVPA